MRIVFVGGFGIAPKSTIPVRAMPMARELVRRGHEVTVLLPPWDNPSDSGRGYEDGGVRVVNVALPAPVPGIWYGALTARMLRAVRALRPDIVHAFKPKGFSGAVAQALLLTRRVPVVVDTDDWEGTGGWNERGGYPWWQRATFRFQERWLLRHADAVTAASQTLVQVTSALRAGREVTYLPNGASSLGPCGKAPIGPLEPPVVLLYTRFVESPPERTAAMLRAVEEPFTLLLVGTGLQGERLDFPAIDAGWVPMADVPAYFALADVAVFPMEDTLLNRAKCSAKLVDLMTAGVPVVAEAVGQCREYIVDGESGVLVPPGDFERFGAAVSCLLTDEVLRRRLSDGARARIAEFSWAGLVDRLEEAYDAARR